MKKIETAVTLANGGMHSPVQYKKMVHTLENHTFNSPRLYHIVFMGSEIESDYAEALKALCFELRRKGIDCEWHSAKEVDDDKGLHLHTFILVESKAPINPCSILNHNAQGWFVVMMQKRGLEFYIAPPKHQMHRGRLGRKYNYASLTSEKLDNCKDWISYLVKNRSKVKGMRNIYSSSRVRGTRPNLKIRSSTIQSKG